MEIIILGFVLFIVGISSIFAYDKYKENQKNVVKGQMVKGDLSRSYTHTNSRPTTKPPTKSKAGPFEMAGKSISMQEFMDKMNGVRGKQTISSIDDAMLQVELQMKEVEKELESLSDFFDIVDED